MRHIRRSLVLVALGLSLSACSTWSTASVKAPPSGPVAAPAAAARPQLDPSQIVVTKGDLPNRPYDVLGDIEVTVNKTTLFHPDPTPAHVDAELREQAAAMGADAVILVKYGKVGLSWVSYGSLDGSGRAVRFK